MPRGKGPKPGRTQPNPAVTAAAMAVFDRVMREKVGKHLTKHDIARLAYDSLPPEFIERVQKKALASEVANLLRSKETTDKHGHAVRVYGRYEWNYVSKGEEIKKDCWGKWEQMDDIQTRWALQALVNNAKRAVSAATRQIAYVNDIRASQKKSPIHVRMHGLEGVEV